MKLSDQQRRTIVGRIWSPKSLRANVANCEGKVEVTKARLREAEESPRQQVVCLAFDTAAHSGCLRELANARIKAGDSAGWTLVRQALWYGALGIVGKERMYWFNRHRQQFGEQRYDDVFITGLWMVLEAHCLGDAETITRLVPVLARMVRSSQCLASGEDLVPRYEGMPALARFVASVLKKRAGINVPEFIQIGSEAADDVLDRWFLCLENEAEQRANIDEVLDWRLRETGSFKPGRRGVCGGALSLITPWEIFAVASNACEW